jgi:hypothetical protein
MFLIFYAVKYHTDLIAKGVIYLGIFFTGFLAVIIIKIIQLVVNKVSTFEQCPLPSQTNAGWQLRPSGSRIVIKPVKIQRFLAIVREVYDN